jgi:predicted Zn-ribbon and HTH transcriptional regulator
MRRDVNKKAREPFVPVERNETIRHEIMEILRGQVLSARDISAAAHIPEKEVYEHLEHIRRSLIKGEHHLTVTPAECKKCGFVFRKREKLKKPGKCPVCRSESIEEPFFSLGEERRDY